MDDLGKRIFDLRKSKGLTLEQVGLAVGVGRSTVRKWENGIIANMRRDKIKKLADALETTPAYIMGWTDDPNDTDSNDAVTLETLGLCIPPAKKAHTPDQPAPAAEDASLLSLYHQLNQEGQEKVVDYAAVLVASGKYSSPPLPTNAAM